MFLTKLISTVRKIAKERPNVLLFRLPADRPHSRYNEGKCSDGTEGCLIGQAFGEMGITINRDDSIRNILGDLGYDSTDDFFESDQIEWCAKVQCVEQEGITWRKSVDEADQTVSGYV